VFVAPLLAAASLFGPYTDLKIQGWTVKVESSEMTDSTWPSVDAEVRNQLYRISRVVPDGPLAKLRTVVIWIHTDDPATPCAAFHPDGKWLKDHGSDPAMAHGVEIANAKNFVSWTYEQPWMLMHELAHSYHFLFLPGGFDNKEIKSVYDADMATKKYDQVLYYNGKARKHYAKTNQMEFFSECTEAYFGQNDFYPFVNAELKTYDPEAYKLMVDIWGLPQKRP